MPVFEVVSGGDRRSLMKRFERKSKQQAISELVDFHLLNCARIEKLEAERDAALARVAELESKLAELEMQAPVAFLYRGTDMGDQLTLIRLDHYWRPKYSTEEHDYIKGIPLYAAPPAQAQHSVPGKYDDVLLPFLKSMEHELHANAKKGDRPSWMQMDRKTALLEIYYHLGKLQKATSDNDPAGIVEYAADVANMAMMLVDVCGLLAAAPDKEVGHE
ncbi:hypothetical protein NB861_26350 [Pseudomonas aeruginosa]|uniref:hypothetical protein n=1 Tax=Pseudomonas aeruginosa TaxID=287 RepID=UPI0022CD5906|nr:hypothetical protein [Pseudomonas aeruginosa]MCZ9710613.1 hypothetical protein [Pseudomonas aeruginosa]